MSLKLPRLGLKIFLRTLFLLTLLLLLFTSGNSSANAGKCDDYFSCNQEIERVKKEIARLQGLENSLENQIAYLDNQIYLTQLEIKAKGEEIKILSGDISDLSDRLVRIDAFLDYQEDIFVSRARAAYTSDQLSSFDIVLAADELDDAFRKIKYLKILEEQDRLTLEEMHETRTSFKEQKTTLANKRGDVERLKTEVEDQKRSLTGQQAGKEGLLAETRGEEERYQNQLKLLEAERAAILAALRSKGLRLGPVSKGDRVATQGNTGCSTGAHIHYSVYYDSNPSKEAVGVLTEANPCNYVQVKNGTCSSGSYPSYSGGNVVSRSFRAPGAEWSILTQSYWNGHRALDLISSDWGVYASSGGVASLVTDSPSFAAVCRRLGYPYNGLGYGIRIDHGSIVTSYWHIKKP